jgi:hypothetical protein
MSEKSNVALSAEQLESVLTKVVQAAREPVLTERDKAEMEAQQQTRKENAENFKQMEAGIQRHQQICDHRTRLCTGADTGSAIVANKNGKGEVVFFICQHCRLVTRPTEEGKSGFVDSVLYDTATFNKFFAEKINTGGI